MTRLDSASRAWQCLAVLTIAAMLSALVGCQSPGRGAARMDDGAIAFKGKTPKGPLPPYMELATKYNAALARITQFTALAQIEMVYHDRNNKRHYEQADQGRVIVRRPHDMAVLVRKFGIGDLFLAGSNAEQYWLFDLTDSGHRLLYQGKQDVLRGGDAPAAAALPLPVQPRDLPRLMGLQPLPETGQVAAVAGGYLVLPSGEPWRVVLDPANGQPVRVDLLDAHGKVHVTALLSQPGQIETYEKPPGAWPWLMKRIELRPRDTGDYLVVHLSAIDDGREDDAISDRAFDLSRLLRTYKPDEVVDLDISLQQ